MIPRLLWWYGSCVAGAMVVLLTMGGRLIVAGLLFCAGWLCCDIGAVHSSGPVPWVLARVHLLQCCGGMTKPQHPMC